MRLGELGLEENVVRTAFSLAVPDTEEIERGPQVTVLLRCIPLLEHGRVTGAVVLLRDISELRRRDRLLRLEGRHHPRDPPPGEEQPADDLVAAAPAGSAPVVARGQGGHRGVGAAHPIDRARARDPVARGRRRRPLRRHRPSARAHGGGGAALARLPDRDQDHRRRRQPARHHRHARWPSCSTSCCRTWSTTPIRVRRARPGDGCRRIDDQPATCCSSSTTTATSCGRRSPTTASGCRTASRSTPRPASACRSCARW